MFLGVVACPNDERDFDGRVFLKRISERKPAAKTSRNKRFSIDVMVNEDIIKGGWKRLIVDGMTSSELLQAIAGHYDLDEFVSERLQLLYNTYTQGGNKKIQVVTAEQRIGELGFRTNEDGEQIQIVLDDLEVFVAIQRGDMLDEDCTCDSRFMLQTIPEVGQAMRESFHWVPLDESIYLFMDNAGGYGTNDAKAQYTEALQQFNIKVVWQVPRSPETNMLDLGVWMSIQSAVQRVHHMRRCHHDALAASVHDAWESYLSPKAFYNVHNRLRVVLRCILDDRGGNRLVETKRGKLFRDATIIDLTNEYDDDGNEIQPIVVVDIEEDDVSIQSY